MLLYPTTILKKFVLNCPGRLTLCMLFAGMLTSCASPVQQLHSIAVHQGFERSHITVKGFELIVYNKPAVASEKAVNFSDSKRPLHVYLEGDGSPWRYRLVVMPDPTPRQPLMLKLMQLDTENSVYLGRPCYNGQSEEKGCDSSLWTSARYSKSVVDSMASGIRVLMEQYKASSVRLFGHSGGGTLALLIAESIPAVTHIVTIAGNLDTQAWIQHHGYTPLYSSLNPARQPKLPVEVQQWHLVGGRDSVIPPQLVKPFILDQPSSIGILLEGYSHGCCWQRIWPNILNAIRSGDSLTIPGSSQFKDLVEPIAEQDNR